MRNVFVVFLLFQEAITWGLAFELIGETALNYLEQRECKLCGYQTLITTFFPRNGVLSPFSVLVYRATEDNNQWLGPAPLTEVAKQVRSLHFLSIVTSLATAHRLDAPSYRITLVLSSQRVKIVVLKTKYDIYSALASRDQAILNCSLLSLDPPLRLPRVL